ncbi:hypothetical protein F5148DRAFT_243292 [Russula earlei]|uniref:Uncharacterized protein n=1 Tax=Russula earlei TaxID=71964 RepID=A0ACC0U3H5_9AGAM|nr:hypothetical protein F5148DRAFT_243292 [Russula earlei]
MATRSTQALKTPQDIVAIFHASFHPTRGNILDWSLTATDDVRLDGVEFSALPSGLHLVEQDVVYFTKDFQQGVCVFHRRQTSEHGQRGFRLSSLGILLARAVRPRPWRHVAALKALAREIYSPLLPEAGGCMRELQGDDWVPAQRWFEERRVRRADLGGAGEWHRWSEELDDENFGQRLDAPDTSMHANPTIHLPHLLRILGPSSLTLYKHVLGRRRILIYTQPPVEPACILCQVAADICFEDQTPLESLEGTSSPRQALKGKQKEGISVLGVVTLHDIERIERESETGRGWIACTTDAVFLEKAQYYDLVIDMTFFSPERASRPSLQLSVQEPNGRSRKPSYRLSTVRFTWSDVKLWNELDRILQLDADINGSARAPPSLWTDAWRLYEDVCLACAGLWTGRAGRGGARLQESWAEPEEPPNASVRMRVRAHGEGIEGRPMTTTGGFVRTTSRSYRRASRRYLPSPWTATPSIEDDAPNDAYKDDDDGDDQDEEEDDAVLVHNRQGRTTLALLQTFHAQTRFWLSRLAALLPPPSSPPTPDSVDTGPEGRRERAAEKSVIQLAPRDVLELELGPLSSLDARFVEWLAEEYCARPDVRVSVRRGWRDLLGLVLSSPGASSSSIPSGTSSS